MKHILGLDLGTGSIGWALVNEAENKEESSSIIKLGVRVNPLTVDEQRNFEQGKSITTNADRTLKRSMRRNLQRYKLRREQLISCMKEHGWITNDTSLYEQGNATTFETYRLRAKAVTEKVTLEELARIFLMINKKRGYKSSRKAKSTDEGQLVDGMAIAMKLYNENITPGELLYQLFSDGKKYVPAFYRSDLQNELDLIWNKQNTYYPDILTASLKEEIQGKSNRNTALIFRERFGLYSAENKGKDKRLIAYRWRSDAIHSKLDIEQIVAVISDVNGAINNSSGYLGAISDRSKELYFKKQTVGQYLMSELDKDPHFSLKNKVFYRLDYLNEFEAIWENQAQYHSCLTPELKKEIRDIIIFYQRTLKSQKGLISICELEGRQISIIQNGKPKKITVGPKVCPKSSPIFQEFKIWQILNNVKVRNKFTGDERFLELEEKETLFKELNLKNKLSKTEVLKLLFKTTKKLDLNYESLEGNNTMSELYKAYQTIIAMSGHGEYDFNKLKADEIHSLVHSIFEGLGFSTNMLEFDSSLDGKELEKQPLYHLWHLLYSYEGDKSNTGDEHLVEKIAELFHFEKAYAKIISGITLQPDYGSLSVRAIRKILPHMKAGNEYSVACGYAGYRHSKHSLTKEEIENKVSKDHLDLLPRNSLRNPVVEKILNQMINVVNAVVDTYGKPDEIRIEMARELKKSAKERENMTTAINRTTAEHDKIRQTLESEFGIAHVSRNDIIRYKLYMELKNNGFKTLYSNTYIPREKLFSKEFDIEHIIPQARLFDDSFSNKTLEARAVNIEKSNQTALDYIKDKNDDEYLQIYKSRINDLLRDGSISKSKHDKLLMTQEDIPDDFINRDLRDTQYIARKAKEILEELVRYVISTSGSITDRLREDWQLIDVMQELNWQKYNKLGLTEEWKDKDGRVIHRIKDWTKRNDHRHHAMDALTIAFTKPSYIQYLNNLNARSNKNGIIYAIEKKELERDSKGKLRFRSPILPLEAFRTEAKKQIENILVSIKTKNKVVTNNINKTKTRNGYQSKIQITPRGQLHNETIYGSMQHYVTKLEKVGSDFNEDKIAEVANTKYRKALLGRLYDFGNKPKNAFTGKNSLEKNPIFLNDMHTDKIPSKVKTVRLETIYTIRKEISPDLKIEKVIDSKIRKILADRLAKYNGNAKNAFSNLDENPIYLNKAKGITIKRVTISGVNNAIALHDKRDISGQPMLDAQDRKMPTDFVNTGNNHHIAIYIDEKGNLQEKVVSFFEATTRANLHIPIIDRDWKKEEGWKFLFTMMQNEYFVFPNKETGFDPNEIDLMNPDNYTEISPNLYRVQKLTTKDYFFRHHLETTVEDRKELKGYTWKRCSLAGILNIVKVRVNHIGQIVQVGEY